MAVKRYAFYQGTATNEVGASYYFVTSLSELPTSSASATDIGYATATNSFYSFSSGAWVAVGGSSGSSSGPAGGDLTGTYPNPSIANGVVTEAKLSLSNNLTANVSIAAHGFAPILPNDVTLFLNGIGGWTSPGGTDSTAWHKTGNTLAADGILGSTSGNFGVKFYANNTEYGRIVDTGPNMNWTGPRLLVGATAAFYPNADIAFFKKDLGDQLTFTVQNSNGNPATPAGSSIICVNDDGTVTGGINLLNSNWPAGGQDGVFPNETAFLAFGGACVLGSQTVKKVRFIANNTQWAYFDPSIADFVVDGGNLKVPNGIINAVNVGAQIVIGNSGNPSNAGGAFKFGKSGAQSLLGDETGGESKLEWTGKSADDTVFRIIGSGVSGGTSLIYSQLRNSDGKNAWSVMTESGAATSYLQKPLFWTMAVEAGYGLRMNVNGANDSGLSIASTGAISIFGNMSCQGIDSNGSTVTFNVTPKGGDTVGSLGGAGNRWGNIWAVTTHFGDVNLDNEKMDSHLTLREATEDGEDVNSLYVVNRRNQQKFKVQLQAA